MNELAGIADVDRSVNRDGRGIGQPVAGVGASVGRNAGDREQRTVLCDSQVGRGFVRRVACDIGNIRRHRIEAVGDRLNFSLGQMYRPGTGRYQSRLACHKLGALEDFDCHGLAFDARAAHVGGRSCDVYAGCVGGIVGVEVVIARDQINRNDRRDRIDRNGLAVGIADVAGRIDDVRLISKARRVRIGIDIAPVRGVDRCDIVPSRTVGADLDLFVEAEHTVGARNGQSGVLGDEIGV